MTKQTHFIENGTVTSASGFVAGATFSGLKTYAEDKLDLGLLMSKYPCNTVGMFTTNAVRSPSVTVNQEHLAKGNVRALAVNSGIANACVGEQGYKDALETACLTASHLGLNAEEVAVCSTGIIGVELPMSLIKSGINNVVMSNDGGQQLARAILTTDLKTKTAAVEFEINDKKITIGGIAKGSGMIHPNMATMLSFITTDANVDGAFLKDSLNAAVSRSFNMISVDGDTSTNDTVLLFANAASEGPTIDHDSSHAAVFQDALDKLCIYLAKEIVKDGEGATKLIEVTVDRAKTSEEARSAAKAIVSSTLVKTAVHGADPNWGRIMMALGNSGVQVDEAKVSLYLNDVCIYDVDEGPIAYHKDAVVAIMQGESISLRVRLNDGDASATAWGCNLSEEYVTFNSAYTT